VLADSLPDQAVGGWLAGGRLVAVALMTTGIALLGVVSAALASWFVERLIAASSPTSDVALQGS
jgi:hypothetical protein